MKLQLPSLAYIKTVFLALLSILIPLTEIFPLCQQVFIISKCFSLKMINKVKKYFSSTYNNFLYFILPTLEIGWYFTEMWSCTRHMYFHELIFITYLSSCFFTCRELEVFIRPIFYRKPQNLTCDTACSGNNSHSKQGYRI